MRAWLGAVADAAARVADRPELWVPGALAWVASVGWLALLAGVARPPTVAELTFFGAGIVRSGAWPWNLVLGLAVAFAIVGAAILLAAAGESVLLRGGRFSGRAVGRAFGIGVACAVPAVVAVGAFLAALPGAAQAEFNAPETSGGPLLRTLLRLAPFGVAVLVAGVVGGAVHAAAIRAPADGVVDALRVAPPRLVSAGSRAVLHAVALAVVRIGFVALAAILLRVLWAPIGVRLESGGFDLGAVLLLLGFVAIWLCLVLAGGALHAWGSAAWTALVGRRVREPDASARTERPIGS